MRLARPSGGREPQTRLDRGYGAADIPVVRFTTSTTVLLVLIFLMTLANLALTIVLVRLADVVTGGLFG